MHIVSSMCSRGSICIEYRIDHRHALCCNFHRLAQPAVCCSIVGAQVQARHKLMCMERAERWLRQCSAEMQAPLKHGGLAGSSKRPAAKHPPEPQQQLRCRSFQCQLRQNPIKKRGASLGC